MTWAIENIQSGTPINLIEDWRDFMEINTIRTGRQIQVCNLDSQSKHISHRYYVDLIRLDIHWLHILCNKVIQRWIGIKNKCLK